MANLGVQNFDLRKNEKILLLQEFEELARQISPPAGLFSGLKSVVRTWLCLNLTSLMQRLGYNKRKLSKYKGKPILLNIGCLGRRTSQYINADLILGVDYIPKILFGKLDYDLLINITCHDKNLSNITDGIFLSHVLEHIPPSLAITALKNCFAYLKPGGCIRVVVPDVKAYNRPNLTDSQKAINSTLAMNRMAYGWGHKFMYDAKLLNVLMEEAGFSELKEVTFREGLLGETDLAKYKAESIYMTGIKV